MSFPSLLFFLLATTFFASCTPQDGGINPFQNAGAKTETTACMLSSGKYPVQSVTHNTTRGEYELFLLETPSCVKSPVRFERVKLARLNSEGDKAIARLDYIQDEDPTLYLTENFKIDLVGMVSENGQPPREESSMWMPFLAGAAGAAVAGMAMNALFSRPQYYMPPPQAPGSAYSRGFGSSGSTYQGAVSNYQQKYNTMPASEQNRGKVKTKPYASGQNQRQVNTAPAKKSPPPKRSFLRRGGRK